MTDSDAFDVKYGQVLRDREDYARRQRRSDIVDFAVFSLPAVAALLSIFSLAEFLSDVSADIGPFYGPIALTVGIIVIGLLGVVAWHLGIYREHERRLSSLRTRESHESLSLRLGDGDVQTFDNYLDILDELTTTAEIVQYRKRSAWRCFCTAAALIFLTMGGFGQTRQDRLFRGVLEANGRLGQMENADSNDPNRTDTGRLLEARRDAAIWNAVWENQHWDENDDIAGRFYEFPIDFVIASLWIVAWVFANRLWPIPLYIKQLGVTPYGEKVLARWIGSHSDQEGSPDADRSIDSNHSISVARGPAAAEIDGKTERRHSGEVDRDQTWFRVTDRRRVRGPGPRG